MRPSLALLPVLRYTTLRLTTANQLEKTPILAGQDCYECSEPLPRLCPSSEHFDHIRHLVAKSEIPYDRSAKRLALVSAMRVSVSADMK
jgi:hypothetical protein